MQLFETKNPSTAGVIQALKLVLLLGLREVASADVRYVLDCLGKSWVLANKISAIRLVRKITHSGVKESKDAVDEYLA